MAAFKVPAETILDVVEALNADNMNALMLHVCALRAMALGDPSGSLESEILDHLTSMRHAPADALLLGWAALSDDPVQVRRIHREVQLHGATLPAWLAALTHGLITRVFTVKYRDDDRISIMFEVTGNGCTFVMSTLIHFRPMGVIEDGYLLHGPLERILEPLQCDGGNAVEVAEVSALQAKESLSEAMSWADLFSPVTDTETWPMLHPVFEKVLTTLPDIDVDDEEAWRNRFLPGYLWNFDDTESTLRAFWSVVDPRDWLSGTRWLVERFAYLTAHIEPSEHLVWPIGFVEVLFTRELVSGGLAEPEDYAEFPRLFERYLRFLEANEYNSPKNVSAVLATMKQHAGDLVTGALRLHALALDGKLDAHSLSGRKRYVDAMLEEVATQMGFVIPDKTPDTSPFPPPKVSVWGLRSTIKGVVGNAGALLVTSGEPLFGDPDMNAVMWHLLKSIAGADPERLEGVSPEILAAAIAWIAGQNNALVGRGRVTQRRIADYFDVSVHFMRYAHSLRDVLLPSDDTWVFPLGAWHFLTAEQRQRLMIRDRELHRMRDDVDALIREAQERENRQGPEGS